MKIRSLIVCLLISLYACNDEKHIPDVSGIQVQVDILRFDKAFFLADTTNMTASLISLQQKYPEFINDYLYNIVGVYLQPDSSVAQVMQFLHDYRPVYDAAQAVFASTKNIEEDIKRGFRFVKYYFPDYELPKHIITFVGPLEGYANVLTSSGLAVGLQLYLGKDYALYKSDYINSVYPQYQSRRFEPQYIPVNCMKNIIDEIYPDASPDLPLAYQMVEAGKRLYVLDELLPETEDSLKTGYTDQQLKGCYENEGLIWGFFLQNKLLYETDPVLIRDYMSDGPRTEVLGQDSPGFIGQFTGWQIVKKWMSNHASATLPQLLETPARQIFEESKYKPK